MIIKKIIIRILFIMVLLIYIVHQSDAQVVVECSSNVPAATAITVTGDCGDDIVVSPVDVVSDSICPNNYLLTRTYEVVDLCGDTYTITQEYQVEDIANPSFSVLPMDTTITCASLITDAPIVSLVNSCVDSIIPYIDTVSDSLCDNQYTLTRLWSYTNPCDESILAHIQTVTVEPEFQYPPIFDTISCIESIDTFTITPLRVTSCDDWNVSYTDTTIPITCNSESIQEKIIRTFTASNQCDMYQEFNQIISVIDTIPPTPYCDNPTLDFQGGDFVVLDSNDFDLASFDACSSDLTFSFSQDTIFCSDLTSNSNLTIDFTITDPCGNSDYCVVTPSYINLPPQSFECPNDTSITISEQSIDTLVIYSIVAESCGVPITMIQTDNSGYSNGDMFPIGCTPQSYSFFNGTNLLATCNFNVNVIQSSDQNVITENSDLFIDGSTKGMILQSADGTCWKSIVSNEGELKMVKIDCPE